MTKPSPAWSIINNNDNDKDNVRRRRRVFQYVLEFKPHAHLDLIVPKCARDDFFVAL